jgi:hypothetical protein
MEIKAFGDKVRISLPNAENVAVSIADTTGVCPVPGTVKPTQKNLEINNIATFSLKFSDVDQVQSQYNLLDGYSAIAMQKLGDLKDRQVMVALIKEVTKEDNMIGTADKPKAVTKDNIYDYLVDARVALTNAGALNGNGFYSFKGNQEEMEFLAPVYTCTPKIFGLMLKSTQLTHPTANADQVIERGQKSMMAGFEIDQDTVLTTITAADFTGPAEGAQTGLAAGAQIGIAATKMAVTYANQYTKVEKLRDPDCFADIVRGLELYGFAVIHPECAVITYFTLE